MSIQSCVGVSKRATERAPFIKDNFKDFASNRHEANEPELTRMQGELPTGTIVTQLKSLEVCEVCMEGEFVRFTLP